MNVYVSNILLSKMNRGNLRKIKWSIYSVIKHKATVFFYLEVSPYRDAEGLLHMRSCMNYAINNDAPIIVGGTYNNKLYRKSKPVRAKETKMEEFEK